MYYRVLDDYGIPYSFGFNERNLKSLAKKIYNFEKDFFDENNFTRKTILKNLKKGCMNIGGYNVESSKTPFIK